MSGVAVRGVRTVCCWLPLILGTTRLSGQACLVLSPAAASPDGTALLDVSLYSRAGAAPAAVQWSFQDPSSSITSLTVGEGPKLLDAGKIVYCRKNASTYTCLAMGLNRQTIANGVIANVTAQLAPGAAAAAISIVDSVAVSAAGKPIPITARFIAAAGADVYFSCRLHLPPVRSPVGK